MNFNETMNTLWSDGCGASISGTHWPNGDFVGVISDVRAKYGQDLSLTVSTEDTDNFVMDASEIFANDRFTNVKINFENA